MSCTAVFNRGVEGRPNADHHFQPRLLVGQAPPSNHARERREYPKTWSDTCLRHQLSDVYIVVHTVSAALLLLLGCFSLVHCD